MPLTIYITEKLKQFVEEYIINNNPKVEHGGFLLGRKNELIIPIFIPNISDAPQRSYQMPTNYNLFLEIDKKIFKMDSCIHFHSHPNHTIPSEADLKATIGKNYGDINIIIAFDETNKKFTWRAHRSAEEQYINFIGKEYETFKLFFANSLGILNLGSCFVSNNGEILIDNILGKAIIDIDMDTLTIYNYLKELETKPYYESRYSKKDLQEKFAMSLARVNKALDKITKYKLLKG